MGDRANVKVEDGTGDAVYLYTHWAGTELPETLRLALAKRWRWDDAQYLTRIIFDTMTEGQHGEEVGFGISSTVGDGAERVLVVDTKAQTVSIRSRTWSFEDYIALVGVGW